MEKKTEKYTSHDIQNELLMVIAHQILRDLTDEMRDSFYTTICDEYTDISNKEQLTLCLRWVDEIFNIHEDFLGFYELENIKSDIIVSAIRGVLLRTQISFDNCRGQCCDGASNMLGKKSSEIILKETKADPKHITPPPLVITIESNFTKPLMF